MSPGGPGSPSPQSIAERSANQEATATDSVLFLLVSLTLIAMILYLPRHIAFILGRAWFYMHGDSVDVVELTKEAVHTLAAGALGGGGGTASSSAAAAAAAETASMVKEL